MNTEKDTAFLLRSRAQFVQRVIDVRQANHLPAAEVIALQMRLRAMADMLDQGVPAQTAVRRCAGDGR